MLNCPEIDFPDAYDRYHDKGVLFRVKSAGKVETRTGRLCVASDSRWMRIDVEVEGADGASTLQVPLSQETVESIRPANKLVQQQHGNNVAFVIPNILSLPPSVSFSQRAA
jgi:hypothetical protein